MSGGRKVGRAKVSRHIGRAPVGPVRGVTRMPAAETHVMTGPQTAVPVFVDDSGRRRRRVRAFLFGIACVLVVTAFAVWLSLSGSPVQPDPVASCTASGTHAMKCPQR